MIADRTLLGITLATTFAAGGVSGWAARDRRGDAPYLPTNAQHVYAKQLDALRARGYADDEMLEATRIHQAYLDRYRIWWDEFCELHRDNLDQADRRFDEKLADLEMRFRSRTGGTGAPK